jgi:hypothetical protein
MALSTKTVAGPIGSGAARTLREDRELCGADAKLIQFFTKETYG